MDELQLHIKIAMLSEQVLISNSRAEQMAKIAKQCIDDMAEMKETVQKLLLEFPTRTEIDKVVKECNEVEKRQWLNLVGEGQKLMERLNEQ